MICDFHRIGDFFICRLCGRDIPFKQGMEVETLRAKCRLLLTSPNRAGPCVHRGGEVRRGQCETCNGKVMVKVFACAKHGECTIEKDVGVRVCRRCGDHTPPDAAPVKSTMLLSFAHGLGDNVQFTAVLRHLQKLRPDLIVDVACYPRCVSLFAGLCRRAFPLDSVAADAHYDHRELIHWPEPDASYADSPSTKAEKHLREVHKLTPQTDLCGYSVTPGPEHVSAAKAWVAEHIGDRPFALIHYEGSSYRSRKNLTSGDLMPTLRALVQHGIVPVVLNWKRKPSEVLFAGVVHGVPGGANCDGAELVALASLAKLCIGIDSGPGLAFAASGAPTIINWTRHHPVHYGEPTNNVVHHVPANHARQVRGDKAVGLDYFERHYAWKPYLEFPTDLAGLALAVLRGENHTSGICWPRSRPKPKEIFTPDDFGGPENCFQFVLPAGIGDISWVYTKLLDVRAQSGREIIVYLPGRDQPRRGESFVKLLPAIRWGGYVDCDSWRVISQALPPDWPEAMGGWDFLRKAWPQNLAANIHLEMGHKLADWMPRFATDYHYPLAIPRSQQDAAAAIVADLPRPLTAVYTSNRDKDRQPAGWALWRPEQWLSFLADLHAWEGGAFVLLGAEWDRDKTGAVAAALAARGIPHRAVIAQPLGVALECLRRSERFIAYPSGIGILANVLRVPGVMLLPRCLPGLAESFADPADIASGAYRAWPDGKPEEVLEWMLSR